MRTQNIFIALMAVLMFVIIISGSALVVLYAMTDSTQSLTSTRNTTPTSTPAQQKDTIVTPGTPIPPPRSTSGNQIRSSLVYLPVLSTSNAYIVKQGEPVTWAFRLQDNNGMSISGKWVNFYIDDRAAKGTWYRSPDVRLVYSGTDSASLSPGVHTLKLDFLGDDTNAPCRYDMTFTVVSSESPIITPTAMPVVTPILGCNFIGDSSTHVFYSAWNPIVKNIKPEHKVCFDTAQQAIAAGYQS